MKKYEGVFSELLENFIVFKRSLGFKYDNPAGELYRFSLFSKTFITIKPILTNEMVQAWSAKRPHEGLNNNTRRINTLRQFAL